MVNDEFYTQKKWREKNMKREKERERKNEEKWQKIEWATGDITTNETPSAGDTDEKVYNFVFTTIKMNMNKLENTIYWKTNTHTWDLGLGLS